MTFCIKKKITCQLVKAVTKKDVLSSNKNLSKKIPVSEQLNPNHSERISDPPLLRTFWTKEKN